MAQVLINIAIMSIKANEMDKSNYYLQKAYGFAYDSDLKLLIEEYLENGVSGESCNGIPTDICIPPPSLDSESNNSTNNVVKEKKVVQSQEENSKSEQIPYCQSSAEFKDNQSLPSPPVSDKEESDQNQKFEKEPEFYSYLKNVRSNEKLHIKTKLLPETTESNHNLKSPPPSGLGDDLFFDPKLSSPQIQEEFLPESGFIQIFGIWKACAAQIDGKELKIYDKETRTIVNMVIPLNTFCKIEPENGISYKKSSIFKLTNSSDEYLFAIQDLQTALIWISKILKSALDIPTNSRGVKLLKTGLGKAPFSLDT